MRCAKEAGLAAARLLHWLPSLPGTALTASGGGGSSTAGCGPCNAACSTLRAEPVEEGFAQALVSHPPTLHTGTRGLCSRGKGGP